MTSGPIPRHLLPDTASVTDGELSIGGCSVVELANTHGTPLFIYDERHLRSRCEEAVRAFPGGVAYATKAFLCKAVARIAHESGMALDVASGGEIYVALAAGVPADRLIFHGNNKSLDELRYALEVGVDRIVVDSMDELDRLDRVTDARHPTKVLLRLNPGIEAHTHEYLQTGVIDSKFGFPLADGRAEAAIDRVRSSGSLDLVGIHAHVGSQVFEASSFSNAVAALAPFVDAADVEEFSIGGGLGVAYLEEDPSISITEWGAAVHAAASDAGIRARITAEPGRAIVAQAALTAYTVGTMKDVPGARTYLSVDGGMSDNPRPVLYGSGYEAFAPRLTDRERDRSVRIVGKHCESGDVIVYDAAIPSGTMVGDVIATPVTGAYGHSMGSNYNMIPRPPVVFVADGEARVVVERERYSDLVARDVG